MNIFLVLILAIVSTHCAPQQERINLDSPNKCESGSECVPHQFCSDGSVVRDGSGSLDVRFGASKCPHYLDVCCKTGDKKTTPVRPSLPPSPEGCGYRNIDGVGFKISGAQENVTEFGEFPWMTAIFVEEKVGDNILEMYQCGGSLIDPSVVMTAAHCVHDKDADKLKIRVGEWDSQTENEMVPHQDREVDSIVIHDDFNVRNLFNDIALLFLEKPVKLAANVNPVCLPPAKTNFDYSRCIATGWGKDVYGREGEYQVFLKKIDLPIVPNDDCEESLRTTRLTKFFDLDDTFLCAGGEKGKDTCTGDGGSPLVCPISGRDEQYYQAGIVSWGIGCGGKIPGVYVSVASLRTWVDKQLDRKDIGSSYHTA